MKNSFMGKYMAPEAEIAPITQITYDKEGFQVKKFKILTKTDTVIEFEDNSEKETVKNGLLKDSLNTVRVVETNNGFGLRVYTIHESKEQSKQRIADYYKAVLTMREADLNEAKQFYSSLQEKM
ncbi:hypothetical protein CI088_01510 [Enterococcus plantarum]|uniref:Uncharacterized protein n=1 Tax=Enterococcus plantarum TaxID=1077675 RepID=A0A2W4BK66_9ENTE|nr:hypothetical protein [Enterococcus plantarum]PZL77505.1 hypothetical protein CI088_01510 [Enterococcus plantarum]